MFYLNRFVSEINLSFKEELRAIDRLQPMVDRYNANPIVPDTYFTVPLYQALLVSSKENAWNVMTLFQFIDLCKMFTTQFGFLKMKPFLMDLYDGKNLINYLEYTLALENLENMNGSIEPQTVDHNSVSKLTLENFMHKLNDNDMLEGTLSDFVELLAVYEENPIVPHTRLLLGAHGDHFVFLEAFSTNSSNNSTKEALSNKKAMALCKLIVDRCDCAVRMAKFIDLLFRESLWPLHNKS